jgi:hypothetical protein
MKIYIPMMAIIFCSSIISCSKKDDPKPIATDRNTLLTSANWKATETTVNGYSLSLKSISGGYDSLLIKYNTDNSWKTTYKSATSKAELTGTWSWKNDTTLSLYNSSVKKNSEVYILTLTETAFVYYGYDDATPQKNKTTQKMYH